MYTLSGSDRRRKTMSTIDPPSKTIFLVRLIMDGRGIRKILAVNPNKRLILELQSPQLWRDSNNTSFECKHNLYSSVMSKEGGRSARPGRSVIAAKRWIATPLTSPPLSLSVLRTEFRNVLIDIREGSRVLGLASFSKTRARFQRN